MCPGPQAVVEYDYLLIYASNTRSTAEEYAMEAQGALSDAGVYLFGIAKLQAAAPSTFLRAPTRSTRVSEVWAFIK